jgi:WD40 repeat protein
MKIDPRGRYVAGGSWDVALILPLDGGDARRLGWPGPIMGLGISGDGRFLLTPSLQRPLNSSLRIWDLDTGEVRDVGARGCSHDFALTPEGHVLLACGNYGLWRWNLEDGSPRQLLQTIVRRMRLSPDGLLLFLSAGILKDPGDTESGRPITVRDAALKPIRKRLLGYEILAYDLAHDTHESVRQHGPVFALDAACEILVTVGAGDEIRVGPVGSDDYHVLLGHQGVEGSPLFRAWGGQSVAVSPDVRWVASAGAGGTLRLWPMPRGARLHTLTHEELCAQLRAATNLRAVRDDSSSTGYGLEPDGFPGWRPATGEGAQSAETPW